VRQRERQGLEFIGREISSTRAEFFAGNGYGAPMLLDGLIGNGYAVQKGDRVALTERGQRALGDTAAAAGA
jgi:hypothetical protein